MKILVTDPLHPDGIAFLRDKGYEVVEAYDHPKSEVGNLLNQGFDALIVRSATKVRKEVIDQAMGLKVIGRAGVGLDNIDTAYAKEKGIQVVNAPEGPSHSVAELALGLMLSVARFIPYLDHAAKSGKWAKKEVKHAKQLSGSTLGIIGTGRIGATLARFAAALDMKVLGYDIYRNPELESLPGFRYVDTVEELLKEADFVSLHIPLTEQTKNFINKERIQLMKKGSILINTGRGGTVDEAALIEALDNGHLFGAALDVFETEPAIDQPAFKHPKIVATPHVGAQTVEAQRAVALITCEKVHQILSQQ